jgi:hypothetical protein
VRPGETTEVTLGGKGRPVVGRVRVIGGEAAEVDWKHDVHKLTPRFPDDPERDLPLLYQKQFSSPEERRKAFDEYSRKHRAFWTSEAGRARERELNSYVLLFSPDGSFRVDCVPSGAYTLTISPTEPGDDSKWPNNKKLGTITRDVFIPDAGRAQSDEPFDLGILELVFTPPPKPARESHR